MRKYIPIHKALKEAREEYGYPTSYECKEKELTNERRKRK